MSPHETTTKSRRIRGKGLQVKDRGNWGWHGKKKVGERFEILAAHHTRVVPGEENQTGGGLVEGPSAGGTVRGGGREQGLDGGKGGWKNFSGGYAQGGEKRGRTTKCGAECGEIWGYALTRGEMSKKFC